MNSLYYGVLWTLLFIYLFIYYYHFLINLIISAEMTSFSLDDEG